METGEDKQAVSWSKSFPVVGIGASAGGLSAFKKLLQAVPANSGIAYVLVQHLDPNHESMLAEILQKSTTIPVLEITNEIKVEPDHIYVIPSNKMLIAADGTLRLTPRTRAKTERNLPIDLFFVSLAEVYQGSAIGVVLSGTSSDGTLGLRAIKDHGGITFAQDEQSAEYEGMPESAIRAGVVDFILAPEAIPLKLKEMLAHLSMSDAELQTVSPPAENMFRQMLSLLRIRKGVDFTYYKQTTVRRRIFRRMLINKIESPAEYLALLRGQNTEQDQLFQDLLIPVTSFFRDKLTFEMICDHVFPSIAQNKAPGQVSRIWAAGCSTGQEVYSIAICFKEAAGDQHEKIQIFGTDLSEPAIAKARSGIYEEGELNGITAEQLEKYFTKNGSGYHVNKDLRELCVFAHHNFLKDPPFGKMDFISCRNVLIYMEPHLQKKALTTFHYALNQNAFLLLGKSETTAGTPGLFTPVEKNGKLFRRKDVPGKFMQVASQRSEDILNQSSLRDRDEFTRMDFQKMADEILLRNYTPAGVVVNEAMDIVHFRGGTALYLEQALGKPTHNLLLLAKHGLGFELRNILHKAKTSNATVLKENIQVSVNGTLQNISIEAIPLTGTVEPYYLVLFHSPSVYALAPGNSIVLKNKASKLKSDVKDLRIKQLEQEQAQAREDMRSITQEQEAANEELQSANEELLSSSEELQSLNEELETSKEELQSTNEELTVLNHELQDLNDQVTAAKTYAESIVSTIASPLLVLDKTMRVKSANQAFYEMFKVTQIQANNVLLYNLGEGEWNIPGLRELLDQVLPQKSIIRDFEVVHSFEGLGKKIMSLNAREILTDTKEEKLILLSIEDLTDSRTNLLLRQKVEELAKMNKELESFTYVSSHDLQEPLRKIQTFAGMILQKEKQQLSEKGKDYFQRMQDAASRMQQLISDLLSFSRVNTGDREFEKINLEVIIDKLKTAFKEEIQEKNVTIEATGLCDLNIISFQFDQLFQNLISNSLKFTKPGAASHIVIHGQIVPGSVLSNEKLSRNAHYCHISFSDNGIGFESKYNEQIFEVFQRLHPAEAYAGTGIGLAIVKKIVENHHGIITATSEPGKGARFDIYIPA